MEEAEEPAPSLVDLLQATALDKHVPAPDLSSDAAGTYLDELLSLPLKALLDEAAVISTEASNVENELTNLCYREYPTFISVHNCSSAVTSAFDDFSSSLGSLLDAVPALEEECRTFVKATSGVQKARGKAALVQEYSDKLFDLLEIPQLMDTCVRNGYYKEALELSAHTDSLVSRYGNVELVQDVAKEVDGVLQLMLAQLLALLREPIKLPALVKTIGYLRRLGTVDESELGLVFLVARLANFGTHLNGLERDKADPVRYVRKYVDLFREHVFDIISQFTAIFLDGPNSGVAATQLASFVGQCVNDLVTLVSDYVPKMTNDTASLSSILVQLGYCSLAFARVGVDFAALITGPFSDAVMSAFTETINTGTTEMTATLNQAAKSHGSPSQIIIAHEYLASLLASDSPLEFIKWDGTYETLPSELSRFPPLAMLINHHLNALNSLRLLAPLHLYPKLAAAQASSLLSCTHAIARYVRQAVAVADPTQGSDSSGRPEHVRRNSGRAHLVRRNSDSLLTPEARSARRKETQWVCVAFADTWVRVVCPLLKDALDRGVYDGEADGTDQATELRENLESLKAWVDDQQAHAAPLSIEMAKGSPKASPMVSPSKARMNGGSQRGTPSVSGASTPLHVHREEEDGLVAEAEALPRRSMEEIARAESPEDAVAEADALIAGVAAASAAATASAVAADTGEEEAEAERAIEALVANGASEEPLVLADEPASEPASEPAPEPAPEPETETPAAIAAPVEESLPPASPEPEPAPLEPPAIVAPTPKSAAEIAAEHLKDLDTLAVPDDVAGLAIATPDIEKEVEALALPEAEVSVPQFVAEKASGEEVTAVEAAEPAEPARPAEPVEAVEAVEAVEPAEPAEPAEPVEPAEPAEPVEAPAPASTEEPAVAEPPAPEPLAAEPKVLETDAPPAVPDTASTPANPSEESVHPEPVPDAPESAVEAKPAPPESIPAAAGEAEADAGAETPGDTPVESTEPSRAPSPATGESTPATGGGGGGKKKKKKKGKKK